jgi:hypothetical protein
LVPVSPSPGENLAGGTGSVPDSLFPVPDLTSTDLEYDHPETQYLVPDIDIPCKDTHQREPDVPEQYPIPDSIPK